MQIGRKYLQGHGRELPKTVGRTSLFVKNIFEKSGQGETYAFDPASLVYLRPMEAAEEEEKKAAPEEERAREYVLREKETMKLITKEEKVQEFYTHIIQESVLPSAQEMLKEKSKRKQLLVQLEILLKECRELEHRTEHFAEQQEIGQVWHSFQKELRMLEQQTEKWNHAGSREEGYLRKQIKEKVEHLFTYRNILENQERQQKQTFYRENQADIVLNRILHKVQNQILELTEEELTELKQELLKQELLKQELLEQEVLKQETESVHARTILEQIRKVCLEELFETTIKKEENRPILIEEKLPQPEMTDKNSQTTWNTKQVQQVTEEIDKIVQKILDVQIEMQSKELQESNYEFQRTEVAQLSTELLTELQAEIGTETTWVQQETIKKMYYQLLKLTEEERTELKQELSETESVVHDKTILDQIRKVCLEEVFETTIKKEENRPILIEEELPQPEMTDKNSQTTWNTKQVQQVTEEIDKVVQKILDVQIETQSKGRQESNYEFQRTEAAQLSTELLTELRAEIGTETTWVQQETIKKMYHQLLELNEEERAELKQELLKQQMLKQETTYEQNVAEFVKYYQTVKENVEENDSVHVETVLDQIRRSCLEEVFKKTVKEEKRSILVETELPQQEMTYQNSQTTWNTKQVQQVTEEIDKVVQKILDVQIETQSEERQESNYEFQRTEVAQLSTELLTELQAEIGTETTWVQQETIKKMYYQLLKLTEEERTELRQELLKQELLKQEVFKQETTYEQNVAEFVKYYQAVKENVEEKDSVHVETVLDQIRRSCLEEVFEKTVKEENRPILAETELPQQEMTYKNSQTTWNTKQVQQVTEEIDKVVQKILDVQIETQSKGRQESNYEFQRTEAGQLSTELLTELRAEIGTETTWVQQETIKKMYRQILELTEEERAELRQELLKQELLKQKTESVQAETVLDQIRRSCLEEVFEKTVKEKNRSILVETELPQQEMTYQNSQTTWNTEQVQQVTEEIDKVVQKILNVQIETQSKEQLFQRIETEQLTTELLTELRAEIGTETTWVQQETIKKMYRQILELTEEERAELKQELLKQELLKQEVLRQETTYEQNVTEFVKRYQTVKENVEEKDSVHVETVLDQIRRSCLEEVFKKTVKEENRLILEEELPQQEMTYKNSQTTWNSEQIQQVTEEIDKVVQKILNVQIETQSKEQLFQRIETEQLTTELLTELQAEIGTETAWVQQETIKKMYHQLLELTEEERTELKQELLKQELLKQEVLRQETTYEQNVTEFVKRYRTEKELSETESVQAETILNQIRKVCLKEVFETAIKEEVDKIVRVVLNIQTEADLKEQPFRKIGVRQLLTELQEEIATETTWVQHRTDQNVENLFRNLTDQNVEHLFRNLTEQNMENLFRNLTEETTYEQIQELTSHPQIQELIEKRELQTPKESGQSDERLQYYQNHAEKVEKIREEQQQQFRMLKETTQQQAEQLVKIENWQQEIKERLLEQEQTQPSGNRDEKTLRKLQEQLRLERLRRGLI